MNLLSSIDANSDQAKSALRWVLTIGAGALVQHGWVTGAGASEFVSVGVGLGTLAWSMVFHGGPTKKDAIMMDPPADKSAGTTFKWPGQNQ